MTAREKFVRHKWVTASRLRLKAVEFERFACFERQRIEIRDGLTLIVGQNNSGKTALLKGLTLLGDLMIEPRRSKLSDFAKYVSPDPFGHQEAIIR